VWSVPVMLAGHRQSTPAGLPPGHSVRDVQAARGAALTWRPALWLVAALVIAVDQATKQWALSSLTPGVKHPLVGELLQIQLVFNSGAAFSFMSGHTWILTVVVTAVTAALIWFGRRARSRSAVVIFGLGIGGAV